VPISAAYVPSAYEIAGSGQLEVAIGGASFNVQFGLLIPDKPDGIATTSAQ